MKIVCTKDQKPLIVEALAMSNNCIFPKEAKKCPKSFDCFECIEKTVEWQIEDGDGDG